MLFIIKVYVHSCIFMKSKSSILLVFLDHTNDFIWFYWLFVVSLDSKSNDKLSVYSSDNLPVIVGGAVGVIVIIGVVLALFVIRYASVASFF